MLRVCNECASASVGCVVRCVSMHVRECVRDSVLLIVCVSVLGYKCVNDSVSVIMC